MRATIEVLFGLLINGKRSAARAIGVDFVLEIESDFSPAVHFLSFLVSLPARGEACVRYLSERESANGRGGRIAAIIVTCIVSKGVFHKRLQAKSLFLRFVDKLVFTFWTNGPNTIVQIPQERTDGEGLVLVQKEKVCVFLLLCKAFPVCTSTICIMRVEHSVDLAKRQMLLKLEEIKNHRKSHSSAEIEQIRQSQRGNFTPFDFFKNIGNISSFCHREKVFLHTLSS